MRCRDPAPGNRRSTQAAARSPIAASGSPGSSGSITGPDRCTPAFSPTPGAASA